MSMLDVRLNDRNSERAVALSRSTGRSPEDLVNEAFASFVPRNETSDKEHWQAAVAGVFGIWRDRTDLPDVREMREAWSKRTDDLR